MARTYKVAIIVLMMFLGLNTMSVTLTAEPAKAKQTQISSATVPVISGLRPIEIVNDPAKYMNKTVSFTAKFVAFSSLGLDYSKAMRPSDEYIGFLIMRDDAKNVIPLSEFKLFMKRKLAEKYVDLEQGDTVNLNVTVFSNALGDPWADINSMSVTAKANPKPKTEEKK